MSGSTIERVLILGTGLIGSSLGLALRQYGFPGEILGWDRNADELSRALFLGAVHTAVDDPERAAKATDVIVLAGPVFSIIEWTARLAPLLAQHQLVTDVGSVKLAISHAARQAGYNEPGRAGFLPGHPMAGKEVSGASYAEAALFANAVWLFTPMAGAQHPLAAEWRSSIERFGCRTLDLDPERHDELCAWVSHMPQMLATALSALFEDAFGDATDLRMIGGRAMREMTRLGASPYSMWRDIAMTNTDQIATALLALEQRLVHLRENLKTPELRSEFDLANRFRSASIKPEAREA